MNMMKFIRRAGACLIAMSFAAAWAGAQEWREAIAEASRKTGCPERILYGIAYAESGFDAAAVGDGGRSLGMFQINMDYRGKWEQMFGGEFDPFDPFDGALLAALIFLECLNAVGRDEREALIAYNAGLGAARGGKIPPSAEAYADKVLGWAE